MLRGPRGLGRRWSVALLRYFNPVGAHESRRVARTPRACRTTSCRRGAGGRGAAQKLMVFGDDYPPRDGTGVRRCIHVVDLADGHLKALDRLAENRGARVEPGRRPQLLGPVESGRRSRRPPGRECLRDRPAPSRRRHQCPTRIRVPPSRSWAGPRTGTSTPCAGTTGTGRRQAQRLRGLRPPGSRADAARAPPAGSLDAQESRARHLCDRLRCPASAPGPQEAPPRPPRR
ncbi:NAD-dependent epimerase/dehydratase family protein [Kocuria rhizophila]|nr:NAD-dependent epimerase/dehydratase family protein [Kocuria rhizophila]